MLAAQMAAAQDISAAEALLFQARHLQNIHESMALAYTYKKDASAESSFDDEVHLDVDKIKPDGAASVVYDRAEHCSVSRRGIAGEELVGR